jgi:hypothetical protein
MISEMIELDTFNCVKSNIHKDYFEMQGIITVSKIIVEHKIKVRKEEDYLMASKAAPNILFYIIKKCARCNHPRLVHNYLKCPNYVLKDNVEDTFIHPSMIQTGYEGELEDKLDRDRIEEEGSTPEQREKDIKDEKRREMELDKALFNQVEDNTMNFMDLADSNFKGKVKNVINIKDIHPPKLELLQKKKK